MVQGEIKMREEENRKAKKDELGSQGAWLRWEKEQPEQRTLDWSDIWQYPQF